MTRLNLFFKRQNLFDLQCFCNKKNNSRLRENKMYPFSQPGQVQDETGVRNRSGIEGVVLGL